MNVNLLERRRVKNFPVRHAIESHAACQTHRLESGSLAELFQHAEIDLFEPRLQRTSQIAVALLERFFGSANWSQPLGHVPRKHFAERGGLLAFGPGHFRASAVMRKVRQPQAETVASGAAIKTHHVAKRAELVRVARSGEPHDFVVVAKFQEAEILSHRGVKQTQPKRKSYRPV